MAIGCVICSEPFSSSDTQDKYPLGIRSCGHAFHSVLKEKFENCRDKNVSNLETFDSQSCLKQWLTKSRTCPVCRSSCNDSSTSICRLHLQSVNNLDTSASYLDSTILKDSLVCAKNKEIEDLQKQLNSCRITIEKIRNYYKETMKLNKHIGIELALDSKEDPIIDLSESPTLSPPVPSVASIAVGGIIRGPRLANSARTSSVTSRNNAMIAARARCEHTITNRPKT